MLSYIKRNSLIFSYIGLTSIVLVIVLFRINFLNFPFERDEGEFAYLGQLWLKGIAPYTVATNMKFPGTYFMYAIIMFVLGESTQSIHLGLLFINLITAFFIWKIISKLFYNNILATIGAVMLMILTIDSKLLGFAAHATHFISLMALIAFNFLLNYREQNRINTIIWAGVFTGLAFLMKQQGVFFIFFGVYFIYLTSGKFKSIIIYCLSIALPLAFTIIYIYFFSDFEVFWFWTVTYAQEYVSVIDFRTAMNTFTRSIDHICTYNKGIWLMSLIGLIIICVFIVKKRVNAKLELVILAFAACSFLTVVPSFHFRPHYYVSFVPAVVLLVIFLIYKTSFLKSFNYLYIVLFIGSLFTYTVYQNRDYYFSTNLDIQSKKIYGGASPFPESIKIAKYIKENTNSEDRILIFANEPQVYFYSNRLSATKYIYTFNIMEPHPLALKMQKEMIAEIEKNKPKYIMLPTRDHWNIVDKSELYLFDWLDKYLKKYNVDGYIEYNGLDESIYNLGVKSENYKPTSNSYITLYKIIN